MESASSLRWKILIITGCGVFMDFFLLSVVIPIIPHFLSNIYGDIEIGLLFASKPLTQIFANVIIGPLIDTQGPEFILFMSSLILTASTALFIYGLGFVNNIQTSYIVLTVARSIQGISSAGVTASSMTWVAQEHDQSIHGTAMGITMTGLAAGLVLGPPVGGTMGHFIGNESPFWMSLFILIINMFFQLMYHHGLPRKKTLSLNESNEIDFIDGGMCDLLRHYKISIVAFGNFLGSFCIGMLEVLLPLFLMDEFGFDQMNQGLTFGISSFVYLVSTPIAGIVSDFIPKWAVFSFGCFTTAIGLGLFYWAQIFHISILALIITGIGVAFVDSPSMSLLSYLASHYGIKNLGSIYALQDICISTGFAFGPLVGPSISSLMGGDQHGFTSTAALGAFLMFGYFPFSFAVRTRKYTEDPHRELLLKSI